MTPNAILSVDEQEVPNEKRPCQSLRHNSPSIVVGGAKSAAKKPPMRMHPNALQRPEPG